MLQRQGPDAPAPPATAEAPGPQSGGDPANQSVADPGCPFPIDDITVFEQIQRSWPLFGASTEIPLWTGSVDLGWLGWIDISVLAGAEAQASLLTALGPGVIRDICLNADPATACVSGTGTLAIGADATPELTVGGSLRGSADYLGRVPLAALGGALTAIGTANAHPEAAVTIDLTYEDGSLTMSAAAELSMALQLTFDLDASLMAELFGEEAWTGSWNLASWQWARVWNVLGRVTVGMTSGAAGEPQVELLADEISIGEILSAIFADLLDAEEIIGGIRGSSVATEVQMLDPMAAVVARASIQNEDYATALDVVVRSLPLDTSLCTIEYVASSDQGEGLTEAEFNAQNVPSAPPRVSIYTPAFASVPMLVSTVMHEYQHVLSFQQGMEPGEFQGDPTAAETAREVREVEAYLWEIEHASETGLADNEADLEETMRRLREHYEALGGLDPVRQTTYTARFVDAVDTVEALATYRCERECQLVTVKGAEGVKYVTGVGYGNTKEKAIADCQRDANRQADEYNRANPDKPRVRARHCSNVSKCTKSG